MTMLKLLRIALLANGTAQAQTLLPLQASGVSGWRGKPFAMVDVNVDRQAEDWLACEHIAAQLTTRGERPLSLRQDAAVQPPVKLPPTVLIDAQGSQVARFEGRMAPEALDLIADLLP